MMKKWLTKIYRRLISDKISEAECLIKLFYNLHSLGIKIPLFPDGYSGNASFLYAILKIVYLGKPQNILELGSGQSTLLLNKLQLTGTHKFQVTSIEHDEHWHQILKPQLIKENHKYCLAYLTESPKFEKKYYDLSGVLQKKNQFDFVIIDGPPRGLADRSDIITYLEEFELLCSDAIFLIDDIEKKSEKSTDQKLKTFLISKFGDISEGDILGRNHQKIYTTGRFSFLINA